MLMKSTALVMLAILLAIGFACSSNSDTAGDGTDTDTDGDTDSDGDTDGDTDTFDECESIEEGVDNTLQPADIIFVIDNSPSLELEIAQVRANMNSFSADIVASGIDARIVIISCIPGDCGNSGGGTNEFYGICIDPPLGDAAGCQGDPSVGPVSDDTNLPDYLHLSTRVPSVKLLEWLLETYEDGNTLTGDGWHSMIRINSTKHVVLVSDDADEMSAVDFNASFLALDPVLFADYLFHGIFSYLSKDDACAISLSEPCCEFSAPEDIPPLDWNVYSDLVTLTGGVSGDLCLQDFDPVFTALTASVISNSEINCEWVIPDPPEGETLDPNMVNIVFTYDGDSHVIGRVNSADDCDSVSHGWYYDDPSNPTMIYVCPQTCDWFQSEEGAGLIIQFGCETEVADPE